MLLKGQSSLSDPINRLLRLFMKTMSGLYFYGLALSSNGTKIGQHEVDVK
jgi:hypothetical protein